MSEDEVLELLGIYMDLTEKQDEIIVRMSRHINKQATELAHLRNLLKVEEDPGMALDGAIIEELKEEYESMKTEP